MPIPAKLVKDRWLSVNWLDMSDKRYIPSCLDLVDHVETYGPFPAQGSYTNDKNKRLKANKEDVPLAGLHRYVLKQGLPWLAEAAADRYERLGLGVHAGDVATLYSTLWSGRLRASGNSPQDTIKAGACGGCILHLILLINLPTPAGEQAIGHHSWTT